jgi:cell division septation protein DedD
LDEPKRVRTLTMRRDPNDPNGQLIDVTSSTRAPDAAAMRDSPRSLDPRQLDTAPSALPTTGGYVVQVSTQRSEARAQASFRLMQEKYPSGFSGRSAIIKRSDLGAKGVFYRTLVGPFASAGDARQFCSSLKAAGGDCIVQKN